MKFRLRLTVSVKSWIKQACCDFARCLLHFCATHVATFCDPCRDFARLHFNYVATLCHLLWDLWESWFVRVRLMIRPWSTLSTLFDSWFDPDQLYRHCSTHDSTRIDPWFDHVQTMIGPCSTNDWTLFDS